MIQERDLAEVVKSAVINNHAATLLAVLDGDVAHAFELSSRVTRIIEQFDIYSYYCNINPADPDLIKIEKRIRKLVNKVDEMLGR